MFADLIPEFRAHGSVTFSVRVRPGMGETKAVSVMDDESIKIDLAAPAKGGKANKELVRFLADSFGVQRDQVKILSGAAERLKLIRIR